MGGSEDVYETFFVKDEKEIEPRIDGYKNLFGKAIKVSYKVVKEDGDAETHDTWGY